MNTCNFCGKSIDSHYDYRMDDNGNMIGDGYTFCLEIILNVVIVSEYFRVLYE